MKLILIQMVCWIWVYGSDGGSQLDYNDQAGWGGTCVSGQKQSPINIRATAPSKCKGNQGPMMNLPDEAGCLTMKNLHNANTIKFEPHTPLTVDIPGIPGERATVVQLHFHWGERRHGSEHWLHSKHFAAESHLVTSYGNGKYAVFARLFRLGDENEELEELIEAQANGEETVEEFDLLELYPQGRRNLLTYEGSLTTPGCDEVVHWVVDPEPLTVSKGQLNQLRSLQLGHGDLSPLLRNWRSPQPLNGREITCLKA